MSVDATATMGYGYMVAHDDLTERYFEGYENDFEDCDALAEPFGVDSAYELVTVVDSYSERSDVFIGYDVCDHHRVDDPNASMGFRFEQNDADAMRRELEDVLLRADDIEALYEGVMGEPPKGEPTMHLYVCWW